MPKLTTLELNVLVLTLFIIVNHVIVLAILLKKKKDN
jgi:hypothetical protein